MSLKRKLEEDDNLNEKHIDKLPNDSLFRIKGYHADRKGERDEMQDEHVLMDDVTELLANSYNEIKRVAYYAVFDGHCGGKASKYCAENLLKCIASKFPRHKNLQTLEQNLKRCFVESYKKLDDDFLNEARKVKPVMKDGTTATAVFILNNVAYVTNLGDSRLGKFLLSRDFDLQAILCRYKPCELKEIALTLTIDHNPTIFEERMRVQKSGGIVKDGRVMGQLEVSRSIGDGQYKNHGVSCIPDVKRCTLTDQDRYMLIACDGLWKTFSNQEALEFIAHTKEVLKRDDSIVATKEKSLADLQNEIVCSKLAAEAVRKGSGDNVTVVMIIINDNFV